MNAKEAQRNRKEFFYFYNCSSLITDHSLLTPPAYLTTGRQVAYCLLLTAPSPLSPSLKQRNMYPRPDNGQSTIEVISIR